MRHQHILLLYLMITCWIVTVAEDCDRGWFGARCQYKCRCTFLRCDHTGLCQTGSECQGGWFGPACQYVDIAFHKSNFWELTDGNDGTCVTDANARRVVVIVDSFIAWIRIKWRLPGFMSSTDINLLFVTSKYITCPKNKNVLVDSRTMDIICSYDEKVVQIILAGTGVPYLCSIYISGGRNVALKQFTSQSSTYEELSPMTNLTMWDFPSDLAVDGNTDPHFYSGRSCSASYFRLGTLTSWSLHFSEKYLVSKYILYYSVDAFGKHAANSWVMLSSYDSVGRQVMDYGDSQAVPHQQREIQHHWIEVFLVILSVSIAKQTLTLCEVEVYGDSMCETGRYGRDCEFACNCLEQENCFVSTGGCFSGCAVGYQGEDCKTPCDAGRHGDKCMENCSDLCLRDEESNPHCNPVTGECVYGCEDGYESPHCLRVCEVGMYGPACTLPCSTKCVSPSDVSESPCTHGNGTCVYGCTIGYKGSTCTTKCDSGTYGQACKAKCSVHCRLDNESNVSPCHHIVGVCTNGCNSGYTGMFCDEDCDLGMYGMHCQNKCSEFCQKMNKNKRRCDHVTGNCIHGCYQGYLPPNCDSREESQNKTVASDSSSDLQRMFILMTVGAIGTILSLIVILFSIQKERRVEGEEHISENVTT